MDPFIEKEKTPLPPFSPYLPPLKQDKDAQICVYVINCDNQSI